MPTYLRMGFSIGYFTAGCLAIKQPLIGLGMLFVLAVLDALLSIAYEG